MLAQYRTRAAHATRLLRRPGTYAGLAREAVWSARPEELTPAPLSWPLTAADLAGVSVSWPVLSDGERAWVDSLRRGLEAHVPVTEARLPRPRGGVLVFGLRVGGRVFDVAVDSRDTSQVDAAVARRVPLYFKFQHALDGYPEPSVVPGGYVVAQDRLYRYLPQLRRMRDTRPPLHDVYGRFGVFGATFSGPPRPLAETLRQPRRYGRHGGFVGAFEVRRSLVTMLAQDPRFRFHGGLGLVLYSEAMTEVARARVCVDAPGLGSFCFRLCDYLAVGACIVAIPHENRLHVPLVDGEHIVYTRPDGSDLGERCAALLADREARMGFVRRSREYFDRFLEPRQLGAYYLATALERLR